MSELLHACDLLLLKDELAFFARHQHEWLPEREGQFVLIGRGTFGGFHPSHRAALEAGIRAFGPVAPFLIRRLTKEEK